MLDRTTRPTERDTALRKMKQLLGAAHVVDDASRAERLSQDITPRTFAAAAFVYPGSTEEVQGLLRIANEHRIPLWPAGQGLNWGYGAASPAQEGAVVMLLSRMNRILEVNADLAYVVIEPGVTFRQLDRYLKEHDIPLWMDSTDGPADGSVLGNALERGIGETPYGDHFGNLCGLEVVLADGQRVRTGGGGMTGYRSWNTMKWGVGPYLEGLFTQSNFGVVVQAGVHLMPRPEEFQSVVFELRRGEDFPRAIDALRRLELNGAVASKVHMINDLVSFAIITDHPRTILDGAATLSPERKAALRRRWNVAPWTFAAGIYGTRLQVRAHRALIEKELGPYGRLQYMTEARVRALRRLLAWLHGGATTAFKSFIGRAVEKIVGKPMAMIETPPHVFAIEKGEPSDYFVKHCYYKSPRPKPRDGDIDPVRDRCGQIWLGPMIPLDGRELSRALDACRALYEAHGFDFYVALMLANPRTMIALYSIYFDKSDPDETRRAEALYFELGRVTQEMGYQQYRTSTLYMDRLLAPAPEYRALAERIKTALDPNHILAPGKYGIA